MTGSKSIFRIAAKTLQRIWPHLDKPAVKYTDLVTGKQYASENTKRWPTGCWLSKISGRGKKKKKKIEIVGLGFHF